MLTPDETRDARLTEFVEADLDDAAERAAIEALLAEDEALARSVADAREARGLLRELDPAPVPADFLRKVKRRIRRRSGGRYFSLAAAPLGYRLSVEVFAVIAIAVMAACFLYLEAGRRAASQPLHEEPALERPVAPAGAEP